MNNTMEYRGYVGTVEYSAEDAVLYGQVQGIRSVISYEGATVTELVEDFHSAVDEYLEMCREEGIQPEKAYKGSFNVRIAPELHQRIAVRAMSQQVTLNSIVEQALMRYMQE